MDGSGTADRVDRVALSPDVSTAGAIHTREVDPLTVTQRLQREGRWAGQIELERNEMMRLARKQGMGKEEAQSWVYGELDRLYPPLPPPPEEIVSTLMNTTMSPRSDDGQIQGLGDLPHGWPDLPANASLSCRGGVGAGESASGGAGVARALPPWCGWTRLCPLRPHGLHWAGWRPVSGRTRSTWTWQPRPRASDDGEAAVMKRERMAIAEVEALLAEMVVEAQG